jgi:hypothetical protein
MRKDLCRPYPLLSLFLGLREPQFCLLHFRVWLTSYLAVLRISNCWILVTKRLLFIIRRMPIPCELIDRDKPFIPQWATFESL